MRGICLLLLGLASTSASWAQGPAAPRDIVQQRLPDGRVVISDRPQPGAVVERTWRFAAEDHAAAQARRAEAKRDAQAVSERIARQIERQAERDQELEIARLRAAEARAEREAALARAAAEAPRIVVARPLYGYWPWSFGPPSRPGPRGPRPGSPYPPRPDDPRR